MTADEYKAALEQLNDEQFDAFNRQIGMLKMSREACVREFAQRKVNREEFEASLCDSLGSFGLDMETEAKRKVKEDKAEKARHVAGNEAGRKKMAKGKLYIGLFLLFATILITMKDCSNLLAPDDSKKIKINAELLRNLEPETLTELGKRRGEGAKKQ